VRETEKRGRYRVRREEETVRRGERSEGEGETG
jgi:hypothetical protein